MFIIFTVTTFTTRNVTNSILAIQSRHTEQFKKKEISKEADTDIFTCGIVGKDVKSIDEYDKKCTDNGKTASTNVSQVEGNILINSSICKWYAYTIFCIFLRSMVLFFRCMYHYFALSLSKYICMLLVILCVSVVKLNIMITTGSHVLV